MGAEIVKVEAPGQPDPIREWGKARYEGPLAVVAGAVAQQEVRDAEPQDRARARSSCSSSSSAADVLTENFRPGTLERWNLGWDRLSEANPKIVLARISGYGQTGPYAERAGFASVAEAMGGIRYINGFPDQPPPRMHISLGDSLAGMFAAQGILAALYRRDALGVWPRPGRRRLAARGVLRDAREHGAGVRPAEDRSAEPQGTNLKGIAPSNIFKSRDGKWIVIAANADKVFRRLCEAIGRPSWPTTRGSRTTSRAAITRTRSRGSSPTGLPSATAPRSTRRSTRRA